MSLPCQRRHRVQAVGGSHQRFIQLLAVYNSDSSIPLPSKGASLRYDRTSPDSLGAPPLQQPAYLVALPSAIGPHKYQATLEQHACRVSLS